MDKIIDGVDVSGCERLENTYCKLGIICKGRDCTYKQLKRKEQECERLKKELKNNSDVLIHEMGLKDEYQSDYVFEKLERQEYRQALQEIRDITREWLNNDWSCFHCRSNMDDKLRDILDKINEVIGEK